VVCAVVPGGALDTPAGRELVLREAKKCSASGAIIKGHGRGEGALGMIAVLLYNTYVHGSFSGKVQLRDRGY
jgi:hypothetical protein